MITFSLSFSSPDKIGQTKLEFKRDGYIRPNDRYSDPFHPEISSVTMKVTNEKKGIFSFYLHNMNKNLNESHFRCSGLYVSIKSVNNQEK